MKRRITNPRLVSEINITPFTDVILVLLVIFMITTPLITQTNIRVKLPEAKSGKPMQDSRQGRAYVMINNEGLIYLNEKLMTVKELRQAIEALHNENADLSVVLRADRMVRFKVIVEVLDTLGILGVHNIDIAVTPEQS